MASLFCTVLVLFDQDLRGAIAKRLCNGLQIRLARFDSGSRLHPPFEATASSSGFFVQLALFLTAQ